MLVQIWKMTGQIKHNTGVGESMLTVVGTGNRLFRISIY